MNEFKSKFKVGDKVRILPRNGLTCDYRFSYIDDMLNYVGTVTTIEHIYRDSELSKRYIEDDGYKYKLEGNSWHWASSMFELVEDSDSKEGKEVQPSELKEGDYIKITSTSSSYNGFIYIFKEYKNGIIRRHVSYNLDNSSINIDSAINWGRYTNTIITYATPEEKKLLDNELLKKGYVWDNVNKKLLEVSNLNIIDETSVAKIPQEPYLSDYIDRVNPTYIPSHPKYGVFIDTDKEELNLFPTKKHYQLNFNY